MNSAVWVLGGGGLTGIAWETGVLAGLAAQGVVLGADDTVLGTSAGSTVAAQVTSGLPIAELYERQRQGVPYEISRSMGVGKLLKFLGAQLFAKSPEAAGARLGKLALAEGSGMAAERRSVIETRLPVHDWPSADLRLVVVDALTGAARVVTRADGLPLVDAVAASCAIPMVWPAVTLGGRAYIDGGSRTAVNLDLAPGDSPVIALAPVTQSVTRWGRLDAQRSRLAPGRRVEVISMSKASKVAQGRNSLDKSVVPAVAEAGYQQGLDEAQRVRDALR
jgi:NTE family protein